MNEKFLYVFNSRRQLNDKENIVKKLLETKIAWLIISQRKKVT